MKKIYEINKTDYIILGEKLIKEIGIERAAQILSKEEFEVIKGEDWAKMVYSEPILTITLK